MFSFTVTTIDNSKAAQSAADKAMVRKLQQASFKLFTTERSEIKEGDGPSAPGTPPHTHTGGTFKSGKRKGQRKLGFLPRSFAYFVDKSARQAVIGPRFSVVGESASAHELGGEYKGEVYPERSFAQPALEKIMPDFADFAISIG